MGEDGYIVTLHKYYINATTMKGHFEKALIKEDKNEVEIEMYMNLWYACLYVVIEGWKELGLTDIRIEQLLLSPNVDHLRRYRNGIFHFQKDYYSDRLEGFLLKAENPVEWVRELNLELGRFFLSWYESKGEINKGIDV